MVEDIAYKQILPFVPLRLRNELKSVPEAELAGLEELRLKADQPVLLRFSDREALLRLQAEQHDGRGRGNYFTLTGDELHKTLLLLAGSSLYALEEELRRGYITLPGGHRAGVAGRAVLRGGEVRTLKEVSGINIRVARPCPGAARPLLPLLLDQRGCIRQSLIISPPRAGKTTMLRDLARLLAEGEGCRPHRVGIVDERSEIAAMRDGRPQLDVGLRSDVLDGCPKAEGLMMLLRSMSPEVLICDELGGEEEIRALHAAANAGVKVVATAHGMSEEELRRRPGLSKLLEEGCFERLALLSRRQGPGTLERAWSP